MCLWSEPTLDELSALAAGDPRRVIDLLDRQWAMLAMRTSDFVRSAIHHHVQHVLPHNIGFLVHRESPFVSTPSEGRIVRTPGGAVNAPRSNSVIGVDPHAHITSPPTGPQVLRPRDRYFFGSGGLVVAWT
jgi:hypothetical protein